MDDLTVFIIRQKHLIYEEKKRLGLIKTENLQVHIPRDDSKGEDKAMVRYGEYSPQNPRYRTPNKLLLGIGEYEERKRLLQEQRKQDYEMQVLAVKQNHSSPNLLDVNAVSKTPSYNLKFADKCIQVECDIPDESRRVNRMYTDECIQVNQGLFAEEDVKQLHKEHQDVKQISGLSTSEKPINEKMLLSVTDSNTKIDVDTSLLSPRERKLLEFCGSGSYNPSFYEKWFPTVKTVPERDTLVTWKVDSGMSLEHLKKKTYQDELRKQIEEKKRLEAVQKEKEKKEEEMIANRVKEQQSKMKMEFEREQFLRRKKMEKRLHQTDTNKSKEEHDINSHSCVYQVRKLDPEAKDDELCSNKYSDENIVATKLNKPRYLSLTEVHGANIPNESSVYLNSTEDPNDSEKHQANDFPGNVAEQYTKGKNLISDNIKGVSNDPSDSLAQISYSRASPYNVEENSLAGVKVSYEAGSVTSPSDLGKVSPINKEMDVIHRKRPVPTPRKRLFGDNKNSESALAGDNNTFSTSSAFERKENLCDSTPIPVLDDVQHVSHVQNYSTTSDENKMKSEAFLKTEAKWQVPAVQKNVIQFGENYKDKYHGRILTQLGAFRRQLQMDQLRIGEKYGNNN